ncbi:galactose mutarotase [Aliishimia ponticola]|uniref:Galactose mutarotase n=1 Tax=Aliishimia ponticola TaxID=2499833 RepID=A0A4S4NJX3_9RHOB|nr:aldose epimerase family protein [Aliishimia ponticola]THH38588.1 galactose mutarotase [Aliishimia ponticola]
MTAGRKIGHLTLQDGDMRVGLLDHGAVTQFWQVGDRALILGYADPEDYRQDPFYLGAIVGRVANRIGGAHFPINGTEVELPANDGPHHLHGGPQGLSTRHWEMERLDPTRARLFYRSEDGESGHPGAVEFEIAVELCAPRLRYTLRARPEREMPISLAQHNYYTLGQPKVIDDLCLQLPADTMLERRRDGIVTGARLPLTGGKDSFAEPVRIGARQMDDFYLFRAAPTPSHPAPVAQITAPQGHGLRFSSDQPGAQIYTGDGLGAPFGPRAGLCVEPSGFPNAVNCPGFPSVIYGPDRPYSQVLEIEYQP